MDVARLGIQIDSSDATGAAGDLDRLTASGARAEKQTNKLGASTSLASDAARRGRTDWRQIGLQFNQVSQQTAATGNFMQALSIQMPDILLGFGSIGVAAGIAAPAILNLGAAMLGTSGDAERLAKVLEDLSEGLSEFRRASLEGAELADYLAEQFGVVSTEALDLAERIQDLRMAEILINAATAVDELTGAFQGGLRSELARLVDFFEDFDYTGELAADTAQKFARGLESIRTAKGPQDQLNAVTGLADMLLEAAGSVDEMTAEQREYYSLLLQTAQRLSLVVSLTGDVASNTGSAADEAARLSENLIAAVNAQNRIASGFDAEGSVQGGRGSVVPNATDGILAGMGGEFVDFDRGGRGRRSRGGGGADRFESDLDRLTRQLMTERKIIDEWYFEGQEILADRRATELLTQEEHNAAKLALEAEYNERVGQLQEDQAAHARDAQKTATSAAVGFLNTLAQHSKGAAVALLAVNTGLRISEAIQNTAVAATRALAELGPILGPPAAAKIKAFGAAQVGLIGANAALRLGAGSGGGGGVGGFASSSAASGGASLAGQSNSQDALPIDLSIQAIDPNGTYQGQSIIDLFEELNEEAKRRGFRSIAFV